jgi:hypothetical protein
LQIASKVDSRIALALPFFKMEMLAIVMPTLSVSSVTLIFRFANMTSMLMMIAMAVPLYRQVVLGFYIHRILQNPFKHRRRGGDDNRREGNENPHENPRRPVIFIPKNHEDYANHNKTDNGDCAIFYDPQAIHGRLRECLILPYVPQYLECLIERREKRNGRQIRIGQEWIVEIYLQERGVRVPAFKVRFPKHKGKSPDANEHNDYLKKYR